MPETSHGVRERGRPRQFDLDAALDLAMPVFREKGYHSASINDLSEAMQLTAGSIYKAFHDKRSLCMFLRVISRGVIKRCASAWRSKLMVGQK